MADQDLLVSIIIPTLNEGSALPLCLDSIGSQDRRPYEVLVIDSGSRDGTREAAERAGALVLDYPGKPLGARHEGLVHSKGELVLLLDADQVLQPGALGRMVAAMQALDMLVLEESSYRPQGYLQRSISRQKAALQQGRREGEVPAHCYPRVYRRRVLEEAFSRLPQAELGQVFAYDDRVLFAKARLSSSRIGFLPRAVMHQEEGSWRRMMSHAYRQGRSARSVPHDLRQEAEAPEGPLTLLKRAARNRYLLYAVLKEASFRLGKALG